MAPACPKCNGAVPATLFNSEQMQPCPTCRGPLRAAIFPAIFRQLQPGSAGERILVEGESSCFYHEQKKAVVPCDNCGRFLCAVCDVELSGRHLCPACIEAGRKKGELSMLENYRLLYDGSALALTVIPLVLPFVGWMCVIGTAPVAIVLAVMSWSKPGSILPRVRWRAIVAILLAVAEIVGWVLMIAIMYKEGVFTEK